MLCAGYFLKVSNSSFILCLSSWHLELNVIPFFTFLKLISHLPRAVFVQVQQKKTTGTNLPFTKPSTQQSGYTSCETPVKSKAFSTFGITVLNLSKLLRDWFMLFYVFLRLKYDSCSHWYSLAASRGRQDSGLNWKYGGGGGCVKTLNVFELFLHVSTKQSSCCWTMQKFSFNILALRSLDTSSDWQVSLVDFFDCN